MVELKMKKLAARQKYASDNTKIRIDHIGYAVNDITNSITAFNSLGFSTWKEPAFDSVQGLWIALLSNGKHMIELVSPDTSKGSSIERLLAVNGPMPYHICFSTDNIELESKKLSEQGFRVISGFTPAAIFDGRQICFLYHKDIGLIELLENKKRNGE